MSTRDLCLAVLLLVASLPAHAGCAAAPTINSAYDAAPLVFRARVLQIKPAALDGPSPTWGMRPQGYGYGTDADPMDHLRLQVLEVFKGNPGTEITVLGGDPQFGKGGEFLVFIMPKEDNPKTSELIVNACSRTGLVTNPRAAADLAWLRARVTAPAAASVSGPSLRFDLKKSPSKGSTVLN